MIFIDVSCLTRCSLVSVAHSLNNSWSIIASRLLKRFHVVSQDAEGAIVICNNGKFLCSNPTSSERVGLCH